VLDGFVTKRLDLSHPVIDLIGYPGLLQENGEHDSTESCAYNQDLGFFGGNDQRMIRWHGCLSGQSILLRG